MVFWCDDWKLEVHRLKTKVVHFRNLSIPRSDFDFECGTHNLEYIDSYKYLGLWFDEFLTLEKAVTELSKSASRALGALFGKFIATGGMTWNVYHKLYTTMVEPVLFYGSAVWGYKSHRVINNVQNKAAKYFLAVGKRTSNTAVRGDLGLTSCYTKQKLSCLRLKCKIIRVNDDRLISKVAAWASRRRKGWHHQIDKLANDIHVADIVHNATISVKTAMRLISEKLTNFDQAVFKKDLYDDKNNANGNKLRTYRIYKQSVKTEQYILSLLPRNVTRTMALFRSGSLPLAVETGRYTRPQIPLNNRLCKFCKLNDIEHETHFLMVCTLYEDIRYELFQKARQCIENFENMSTELKFNALMTCNDIQVTLSYSIHKFYVRRKSFL